MHVLHAYIMFQIQLRLDSERAHTGLPRRRSSYVPPRSNPPIIFQTSIINYLDLSEVPPFHRSNFANPPPPTPTPAEHGPRASRALIIKSVTMRLNRVIG